MGKDQDGWHLHNAVPGTHKEREFQKYVEFSMHP